MSTTVPVNELNEMKSPDDQKEQLHAQKSVHAKPGTFTEKVGVLASATVHTLDPAVQFVSKTAKECLPETLTHAQKDAQLEREREEAAKNKDAAAAKELFFGREKHEQPTSTTDFTTALKDVGQHMGESIVDAGERTVEVAKEAGSRTVDTVKDLSHRTGKKLEEVGHHTVETVKDLGAKSAVGLKTAGTKTVETVKEVGAKASSSVKRAVSPVVEKISSLKPGSKAHTTAKGSELPATNAEKAAPHCAINDD